MKTKSFTSRAFSVGVVLSLSLSLLVSSCARESASDREQPPAEVSKASNPDNPYDFVGELHNEALELAMEMGRTRSQTTDWNAVKDGIDAANIVLSKSSLTRSGVVEYSDEEIDEMLESYVFMIEDIDDGLSDYLNSLDISPTTRSNLKMLFEDALSQSEPSLEAVVNDIKSFETGIISDRSDYSSQEYEAILSTTSTLRYSCVYWDEEFSNSNITRAPKKWWQWLVIAVCDAGGAIAGASGGPATAVSAGVGASNLANTLMN